MQNNPFLAKDNKKLGSQSKGSSSISSQVSSKPTSVSQVTLRPTGVLPQSGIAADANKSSNNPPKPQKSLTQNQTQTIPSKPQSFTSQTSNLKNAPIKPVVQESPPPVVVASATLTSNKGASTGLFSKIFGTTSEPQPAPTISASNTASSTKPTVQASSSASPPPKPFKPVYSPDLLEDNNRIAGNKVTSNSASKSSNPSGSGGSGFDIFSFKPVYSEAVLQDTIKPNPAPSSSSNMSKVVPKVAAASAPAPAQKVTSAPTPAPAQKVTSAPTPAKTTVQPPPTSNNQNGTSAFGVKLKSAPKPVDLLPDPVVALTPAPSSSIPIVALKSVPKPEKIEEPEYTGKPYFVVRPWIFGTDIHIRRDPRHEAASLGKLVHQQEIEVYTEVIVGFFELKRGGYVSKVAPGLVWSTKLRLNCPKQQIHLRAQPNPHEPASGKIKHDEEIEVFFGLTAGFLQLTHDRGYVMKNTTGVSWKSTEVPFTDRADQILNIVTQVEPVMAFSPPKPSKPDKPPRRPSAVQTEDATPPPLPPKVISPPSQVSISAAPPKVIPAPSKLSLALAASNIPTPPVPPKPTVTMKPVPTPVAAAPPPTLPPKNKLSSTSAANNPSGSTFEVKLKPVPTPAPAPTPAPVELPPILDITPTERPSFRIRLWCPGKQIRIRAGPSKEEAPIGSIRSGEVIQVYSELIDGFFEIIHDQGYVSKYAPGAQWSTILKLKSPGLQVKLRSAPDVREPAVGMVKHDQSIEVFFGVISGFFQLTDNLGYVMKNTAGVSWSSGESPRIEDTDMALKIIVASTDPPAPPPAPAPVYVPPPVVYEPSPLPPASLPPSKAPTIATAKAPLTLKPKLQPQPDPYAYQEEYKYPIEESNNNYKYSSPATVAAQPPSNSQASSSSSRLSSTPTINPPASIPQGPRLSMTKSPTGSDSKVDRTANYHNQMAYIQKYTDFGELFAAEEDVYKAPVKPSGDSNKGKSSLLSGLFGLSSNKEKDKEEKDKEKKEKDRESISTHKGMSRTASSDRPLDDDFDTPPPPPPIIVSPPSTDKKSGLSLLKFGIKKSSSDENQLQKSAITSPSSSPPKVKSMSTDTTSKRSSYSTTSPKVVDADNLFNNPSPQNIQPPSQKDQSASVLTSVPAQIAPKLLAKSSSEQTDSESPRAKTGGLFSKLIPLRRKSVNLESNKTTSSEFSINTTVASSAKKRHSITSTADFVRMTEPMSPDAFTGESADILRNLSTLWAQRNISVDIAGHSGFDGFEDDDFDDDGGEDVLARINEERAEDFDFLDIHNSDRMKSTKISGFNFDTVTTRTSL